MNTKHEDHTARRGGRKRALGLLSVAAAACLWSAGAIGPRQDLAGSNAPAGSNAAGLEETRLKMSKWLETQQLVSKERKEWQQGKEVLLGRLDLVKQEIASLEQRITEAQTEVDDADQKRDLLLDQNDRFRAAAERLADTLTRMEARVRELHATVPEPVQARMQLLYQRMPEDPAKPRASVAERFQNVLGILNEVNKANNEISVNYEIHELADGKPAEVKAIYIGLAQAYYVSSGGEAGIGRPRAGGWEWQPSKALANEVLKTLEIIQGKHTPEFVPLPAKIQ